MREPLPRAAGREKIRYLGEFDNTPDAVAKLVRKMVDRYEAVQFCYERGRPDMGFIARLPRLVSAALW